MKNFIKTLSILSMISGASATYHDGDLCNAYEAARKNASGTLKICQPLAKEFDNLDDTLVSIINLNTGNTIAPNKSKRTISVDLNSDTYGFGLGSLSGTIDSITVNKSKGLTTFNFDFTEGYYVVKGQVSVSYHGLTSAGRQYFAKNAGKKITF